MILLFACLYAVALAAFTYWRREFALVFLVAILPVYGARFSIAGFPTTALELSIWAVALGWSVRSWTGWKMTAGQSIRASLGPANPFHPYVIPIVLWLVISFIASLYSPNALAALGLWRAYFVEPLMVFVMIIVTFKNKEERWCLVWALGGTVVAMSLLAWYQHFTGAWLPEPWATNRPLRVTSWYSYPNAVGLYVAPVLAMFVTSLLLSIKKGAKNYSHILENLRIIFFGFVVFILGLGAIIFAVSKGAWVGFAAGLVVAAFLLFRERWKLVLAVVAIIAAVSFSVSPIRNHVFDEFLFRSPSGAIRLVVWQETAALLRDHPLAGAGLAGYQQALAPYHQAWRKNISPYKLEIFLYPHNVFLNFWVELGLAGLIVFLWLEISFFRQAWKKRDQLLSIAAMSAMTALLVHGLVDVPYFKNDLAVLFWVIMAIPLLEPSFHVAHRDQKWFDLIKSGEKSVEARLYDNKRQALRIGDSVQLVRRPDGETLNVEIVELNVYSTFPELLMSVPPSDFGFENEKHGLEEIRKYYSEEEERRHGVVGIRIKVRPS